MILKYGRELAEYQAKGVVKDAVITVPNYFNQEKRAMMITAAELAGLLLAPEASGAEGVPSAPHAGAASEVLGAEGVPSALRIGTAAIH